MNANDLIHSAKQIPIVSVAAVEEYASQKNSLVDAVNKQMLAREDINKLIGTANIDMMKDNHNNHAMFVASILASPNPEQLVSTVIWVFKAYRSRDFHPHYWAAQLQVWLEVMKNNLQEQNFLEILPFYNWLIVNIPTFTSLSESIASDASSLDEKPMH